MVLSIDSLVTTSLVPSICSLITTTSHLECVVLIYPSTLHGVYFFPGGRFIKILGVFLCPIFFDNPWRLYSNLSLFPMSCLYELYLLGCLSLKSLGFILFHFSLMACSSSCSMFCPVCLLASNCLSSIILDLFLSLFPPK
jgi:hypothetical protein